MKILIVGSDLNAFLLARYIKLQNNSHDIFLTTDEACYDDSYTPLNIKENDIYSIVDFVKYNQIEYTIVSSSIAIINGIADEFKKENFPVFAPFAEAARITYFTSIAKKIMYKLKINTPKFGIFDRENLAADYIRNAKFPIVIENDFTLLSRESNVYNSFSKAKLGIQKLFENNNEKIVIENYIDSPPIYVYFITDGYNALPLISLDMSINDNFTTITAPCIKISQDLIISILQKVIYPLLDDISKFANVYMGIVGLKIKLVKDSFYVLEFYNGFQDYHLQAFLSLLDDNLLDILYNTTNGSIADSYECINKLDGYSYTVIVNKKDLNNKEIEEDDLFMSEDKEKQIFTSVSSSVNGAKNKLFGFLEAVCFEKLIQDIKQSEEEKEIRI